MLNKVKQILKNNKGGITTIEILGWLAAISLILVVVITKLKPDIVGPDSILTDSSTRIQSLETIMKP